MMAFLYEFIKRAAVFPRMNKKDDEKILNALHLFKKN